MTLPKKFIRHVRDCGLESSHFGGLGNVSSHLPQVYDFTLTNRNSRFDETHNFAGRSRKLISTQLWKLKPRPRNKRKSASRKPGAVQVVQFDPAILPGICTRTSKRALALQQVRCWQSDQGHAPASPDTLQRPFNSKIHILPEVSNYYY